MAELVSLDQAKAHVRYPEDIHAEDDDLQRKLTMAQAIVIDHAKQRISGATEWAAEVDAWTDETAKHLVIQAIVLQFGAMVADRGDDLVSKRSAFDENGLAHGVNGLLRRVSDPALS